MFLNSEALGFQSLNNAVCAQFFAGNRPRPQAGCLWRKQSARWQSPFSETRLSLHYDISGALKPDYHYTTIFWTRTPLLVHSDMLRLRLRLRFRLRLHLRLHLRVRLRLRLPQRNIRHWDQNSMQNLFRP